jgi:hypothetical protein
LQRQKKPGHVYPKPYEKLRSSSKTTQETLSSPNGCYSTALVVHPFPTPNGQQSSATTMSTSTRSSHDSSPRLKKTNASRKSANLKSRSEVPSLLKRLQLTENGSSPGDLTKTLSCMRSLIDRLSSPSITDTSTVCSQPYPLANMNESSTMTKLYESESEMPTTCNSPISTGSEMLSSVGNPVWHKRRHLQLLSHPQERINPRELKRRSVDTTTKDDALTRASRAITDIFARNAASQVTPQRSAQTRLDRMSSIKPRYARDFIWSDKDEPRLTLAKTTEVASPVPDLPQNERCNVAAIHTIASHPELFKIVTPIKVNVFESKLRNHPNRAFVQSVCRSLREGFWPWANTDDPNRPVTYDNSKRELKEQAHHDFLIQQVQEEVALGQFSCDFGPELLPGMYSQPIGVVPKPHSDKFAWSSTRAPNLILSTP